MVSSIIPGTTGANALAVDPRYTRPQTAPRPQNENAAAGDRVDLGGTAAWSAARESVRAGLAQLQTAIAAGHDAFGLLATVSGLAQSGDQAGFDAALSAFKDRVQQAISQGASILAGDSVSVQAEPGAPDLVIPGLDLRLQDTPGETIALTNGMSVDDPNVQRAAQRSLDALQAGMDRLLDASRALDAHQGFIGAAQGAVGGVRTDLDADAARLLALQVRQGLDGNRGAAIANVEPAAVLSLFKV